MRSCRTMWQWYCGELDQEMYDFAASLRPAYTTAILSNSADGARREEQARYGFEQLVDVVIYSHEVGLAKPDPASTSSPATGSGWHPDEIVFIDDTPLVVDSANEFGWHAVLHDRRHARRTIADRPGARCSSWLGAGAFLLDVADGGRVVDPVLRGRLDGLCPVVPRRAWPAPPARRPRSTRRRS